MLFNKVMIKPNKADSTSKSGMILLSKDSQQKKSSGVVVSVGKDVTEVKEGENVVYDSYSGTEVLVKEELHVVVEDKAIQFVIE